MLPTLCCFPSGCWTQADVRRPLRAAIRGVLLRAASEPLACEAWQAQQGARAACQLLMTLALALPCLHWTAAS